MDFELIYVAYTLIGVWISGFFGSGKSSFAKNLGNILVNRQVLGKPASDLFVEHVRDDRIQNLLKIINQTQTEVIMFDVNVDLPFIRATESLAEIMYTALLRELDYATDYGIAELEIELEKEGKLKDFIAHCEAIYHREWRLLRKGAQKFSRASTILHRHVSDERASYLTVSSGQSCPFVRTP